VVNSIPLASEVTDGLLTRKGHSGEILRAVIAYEQCDWDTAVQVDLDSATMQTIYLDSIYWSKKFTDELKIFPK
jgi:c-di-GMP-related signal transduction protein